MRYTTYMTHFTGFSELSSTEPKGVKKIGVRIFPVLPIHSFTAPHFSNHVYNNDSARDLTNWKRKGHKAAKWLGPDRLVRTANKFGKFEKGPSLVGRSVPDTS